MTKKRYIASMVEILLGTALLVTGCFDAIDEFWSGLGGGLLIIGILQLIRQIRYQGNTAYRETVDTERNDERNKYLSMRAWSYAGYLFVLIAAVATIALKLAGHDDLMMLTSGSVCLIMLLYWLSYLILRKKY